MRHVPFVCDCEFTNFYRHVEQLLLAYYLLSKDREKNVTDTQKRAVMFFQFLVAVPFLFHKLKAFLKNLVYF